MCGFLCIFRAFLVCALCSSVFSFLQSLPPQPFFRSNSFRCSSASSMLSLCASSVQYPPFLAPVPPPFLRPLPFPFIFPLCTAPDTCPIFSLRAFRPGTSSSLSSFLPFFLRPWAFRSPCACFQSRCPHLPGAIPPFPRRLSLLFLLRSRVFLPLFSALFLSFVFH